MSTSHSNFPTALAHLLESRVEALLWAFWDPHSKVVRATGQNRKAGTLGESFPQTFMAAVIQGSQVIPDEWRMEHYDFGTEVLYVFCHCRLQEWQLEQIWDTSPQAVVVLNKAFECVYVNPRFELWSAHPAGYFMHKQLGILVEPTYLPALNQALERALAGQEQSIEISIINGLGASLNWLFHFRSISQGRVLAEITDVSSLVAGKRYDDIAENCLKLLELNSDLRSGIQDMLKAILQEVGMEVAECWLPDDFHLKERMFAHVVPDVPDLLRFRDVSSTLELEVPLRIEAIDAEPDRLVNVFIQPGFSRVRQASEAGLQIGYYVPVYATKKKVAGLYFFSRNIVPDELHAVKLIRLLASRLGMMIESRRIAYESEQIFQLVPDLLSILDQSGRFHRVNRRLADLMDEPLSSIQGASFFDWVEEEYVEIALSAFQRLQMERQVHFEVVVKNRTGKRFWLEWSISLGDQYGLVYAAGQDLSTRMLYDEELRNENERFYLLRQATNDAIYDWDIKGNRIDWGDTFQRLFGYEQNEEATIENWESFIHPTDVARVMGNLHACMVNQDKYWSDEYQYRCADGSYKFILDRGIFIYDEKGQARRMIGLMQDITALKRSEETLIQLNDALQVRARQLLGFNKELEQFAYIVSHDLQEPLRMISSFMQLLLNSKEVTMTERSEQYISFAIDGANRMKRLIQDLLTYSRVGATEEDFQELDPKDLIRETLVVYQQVMREKEALITVHPMPQIRGIRSLLQQLFDNLISNALKYNDKSRPKLEIGAIEHENQVEFFVKDNGIGIDPRHFETIYVPFKRLHHRNEYSGTGIGLAVCKKIVEKHEGQIWVESVPGEGSTFFFSLKKGTEI